MVSEQMMATHAKSKMAANLLRLGFIDFLFLVFRFSVYICVGLFLAAVQTCFCPIKRKPRSKPAMFFIARYKTAKNFPRRLLGILTESVRTIRLQRSSWRTSCSRNPRMPATRHSEAAITFMK